MSNNDTDRKESIARQLNEIRDILESSREEHGVAITTTGEVAEEIGVSRWVARQRLRRLEGRGEIEFRDRALGWWQSVDHKQ